MITEKVPKSFSKNEIFFSITNFSQPIYKPLHNALNVFLRFFYKLKSQNKKMDIESMSKNENGPIELNKNVKTRLFT